MDLSGKTIDRYQILEQLGQGGMATVFMAFDTRLECNVALKIIRKDAFPPAILEKILKRFEREAKSMARLNHPNIVRVIDYGYIEGSPFLVMPYIPSGTLKEKINRHFSYSSAAKILVPISRALAYAHDQKIIHRDIKPSNILITQSGEPLLSDFGIAKILEEVDGNTLTSTGMGLGTPEYMAPEQWHGKTYESTDQYALGVMFFEMITEHKPYTAATPPEVMLKQATEPLPKPRLFKPDLPEQVEFVILKMLDKNADLRYQNMHFLSLELEKIAMDSLDQVIINNSNEALNNIQNAGSIDIKTIFTENASVTIVKEKNKKVEKLEESEQFDKPQHLPKAKTFDELDEKNVDINQDNNNKVNNNKDISSPVFDPEIKEEIKIDDSNNLEINNQSGENNPEELIGNNQKKEVTKKFTRRWLWFLIGVLLIGASIFAYTRLFQPDDLGKLFSLIQPTATQTIEAITPTLSPTLTSTLSPTQESTPTIAPSPTFTPTTIVYKLPYIISPENADQVALIRNIGNGKINDLDYSKDGKQIALASASGVVFLDSVSLEIVNYINTGTWVESIKYSPNGENISIGLSDFTIQLWDINTGQLKTTMKGHSDTVTSLAFSPDGLLLASTSVDKTIIIWNVESARLLKKISNHTGEVFTVDFSPDGSKLISGSADKTIRLWDTGKYSLLNTFTESSSYVDSVKFSPDGKFFAAGSRNGEIRIWDLETGSQVSYLDQKTGSISSICFSPDGKYIASGKWNAIVEIWNIENEEIILSTQNHTQTVSNIVFSPDGTKLAIGSYDTRVSVIDIESERNNLSLGSEFNDGNGEILFSNDGINIHVFETNSIKMFNSLTGELIYNKESSNNDSKLFYSNTKNFIIRGKIDNTLDIIDLSNGEIISNLSGHSDAIKLVVLSKNDQYLATSSSDKSIKIWEPFEGSLLHSIENLDGFVTNIEFQGDDNLLFIHTNYPSKIQIWNIDSGQFDYSHAVSGKVSPDGSTIATISEKRNIQIIDTKTGEILFKLTGHLGNILDMKFLQDGEKLLSLGKDNTIRIWNTKDGKLTKTFGATLQNLNNVIFSQTERYIANFSADGLVRFWDIEKGFNTQVIRAHSDPIYGITFSPNEKLLVTWSNDKTIKIWDISSNKLLNTLKEHATSISGVIFSPNGRVLVSWPGKNYWGNGHWLGGDATIRIWYVR